MRPALTTKTALAFAVLSLGAACSNSGSGTTGSSGSGSSSGVSSSGDAGKYTIVAVDPKASPKTQFAMSISSDDRVGIVYMRLDAGLYAEQQNVSVLYSEVKNKAVEFTELVNVVQLQIGATVAFQPSGEPAIGYFGGSVAPGQDAGPTGSVYWLQSAGEIDYRQGTNSWLQDLCMISSTGGACQVGQPGCIPSVGTAGPFNWVIDYPVGSTTVDMSAEALCDNPFGTIVGLWPSLVFDGGTAVMALRDVHEGQFPIQDWGASDAKMCIGGPSAASFSWSAPMTISAAGNNKVNGYGVHNQLIFGKAGALALINDTDTKDQGSLTSGSGPINFVTQTGLATGSNADWTQPIDPFDPAASGHTIENPGSGARMVYNATSGAMFGYGVVATDISTSTPTLYYVSSTDGASWTAKESVYGLGSGGFFPDLAVNPNTGNPVASYTICSQMAGSMPDTSGCSVSAQELDTAERTPEGWNATTEITGNFWMPRFGYLSTAKKVFVYTDLDNGGLYVAFEN